MPFEIRMKIYTHDNIPEGVVNVPDSYVSDQKFSVTNIHLNPNDYKKLVNFLTDELMDKEKMRKIKEANKQLTEEARKIGKEI